MLSRLQRFAVGVAVVTGAAYVVLRFAGAPEAALPFKPWPVWALAVLVLARGRDDLRVRIAAGLFLSGVGDVLLERPGEFVAGMASFGAAHVAYTLAFVRSRDPGSLAPIRAVPVAVYVACLVSLAWPELGPLRTPVLLYGVLIGIMVWRALARATFVRPLDAATVAAFAACVFALSDSMILLRIAHVVGEGVGPAVLATYWLAQAGIAHGALDSDSQDTLPRGSTSVPDLADTQDT